MMRRAVANKGLTRYVQAKQDLETVLQKEPNNKQALVSIVVVACHSFVEIILYSMLHC